MIGAFRTIEINGETIYNGNKFTLSREWIYAAEIETCTGKRCADVVGWRYADLPLEWDNLPQDQLQAILSLSGEAIEMTFTDEANQSVSETVIPTVSTATLTRYTDPHGDVVWSGVKLNLRFIDAHNN